LTQSGGVRPRVRGPRPPLRLSLEERETISRGLAQKKTLTGIAGELGRSVSTVSREVARNSGANGYRAARADRLAVLRTSRPRPRKLAEDRHTAPLCGRQAAVPLVAAAGQPPTDHRVPARCVHAGVARDHQHLAVMAWHGSVQDAVGPLTTRPRQTLRWQTPHEVFCAGTVAMIA
jgi:hypothetical protein